MDLARLTRNVWPLVGREAEVARLASVLRSDEHHGVLLAGGPGVGKTRLAHEGLALGEQAGRATAFVAGSRAAAAIPLGAFAPLLPIPSAPVERRFDVLHAAVRSIAQSSDGRRVVLAVDDAHLLDELSATVLHQLLLGSSTFVVATVRTGEPAPDVITDIWGSGLVDRIDVVPLLPDDVERLLVAWLGGPVEGSTLRDMWEASQGNPLFLRELVMGSLEAGLLGDEVGVWRLAAALTVFPRLVELVEARLVGLTASERDALEAVAVAETVGEEMLARLASARVVERVERKGLLTVEQDGRRRRARLTHPLYGEALREGMPAIRRLAVERELADLLESYGTRRREDVLRTAVLRLDAGGPSRPELLLEGARRALCAHDPHLAERLTEAAIEAGAGPQARITLARARTWQFRGEDGLAALDPLVGADLSEEDRTEVAIGRAETLFFVLGRGDEAEAVLHGALEEIRDPDLRDDIIGFRTALDLFCERPLDAIEGTEQVLARGGRPGRGLIGAILAGVPALAVAGRAEDAVALSDRFAGFAQVWEEELPFVFGQYQAGRFVALRFAGRLEEGLRAAEDGYASAVARRDRQAQGAMASARGLAEIAVGRSESASRWLREAVSLMREADPDGYLPLTLGGLVQARALGGDVAEADALLAEANQPPWRVLRMEIERANVWAAAASGDLPRAQQAALLAAGHAQATGQSSYEVLLLHDTARLGASGDVAGRLAELVGSVQGALVPVYAAHAEALVHHNAEGLSGVSASFERHGALLLAAECAAEASASYRRAGEPRRATGASRRAAALAAQCEGPRTPALATAWQPASLTPREREVALLAAQGLPNRTIAAELVLSVRTVENHLQRAYEKLGVASRRDLGKAMNAAGHVPVGKRQPVV